MTQPEPWKGAAKRLARELGRAGWHVEAFGPDGRRFWHHASATSVIATRAEHDGQEWLHASTAHPDRMPTWDELKALKVALVGVARSPTSCSRRRGSTSTSIPTRCICGRGGTRPTGRRCRISSVPGSLRRES